MPLSFDEFRELRNQGLTMDQITKFDSGNVPQQRTTLFPTNLGEQFQQEGGVAGGTAVHTQFIER